MEFILGESAARRRFGEIVSRAEVALDEASLAIAAEEYPALPAERYLAELDALAAAVRARLAGREDAASVLRALRAVLFEEAGFKGNADAYYDPRNSFLNEVIDRRLGIPITLSVLYMEVARRVGFRVEGVGFPGHFLVKHVAGSREVFIDPFHGGEVLSAEDCVARFQAMAPARMPQRRHLEAVSPRHILRRMLHNLRKIYVDTNDDVRSLWVMDRLVLLAPDDPAARRDRGLVEARLGGTSAALVDLEAYLAAAPGRCRRRGAGAGARLADQGRPRPPQLRIGRAASCDLPPGAPAWQGRGRSSQRESLLPRRPLTEDAQPLDGLPAHQVALDQLRHVGHGDPAVPDRLRVDHHGDAVRAGVEAAGGVGADRAGQPAPLQLGLERLPHLDPAPRRAAAARVVRRGAGSRRRRRGGEKRGRPGLTRRSAGSGRPAPGSGWWRPRPRS